MIEEIIVMRELTDVMARNKLLASLTGALALSWLWGRRSNQLLEVQAMMWCHAARHGGACGWAACGGDRSRLTLCS